MTQTSSLRQEFVDYIPEALDDGVLYVSIPFTTVAHRCCCGCGHEIVTPLDPTDWEMTFDGRSISLYPSIGNWSLACQSHYWIYRNEVRWARRLSMFEIKTGRAIDRIRKAWHRNHWWQSLCRAIHRWLRQMTRS